MGLPFFRLKKSTGFVPAINISTIMPFKPGNKLGVGGPREGSGRKPDKVQDLFQRILRESGAHKRFQKILNEEKNPEIFLKAYQISLNRAYGKEIQPMEISGQDGDPLKINLIAYADDNDSKKL